MHHDTHQAREPDTLKRRRVLWILGLVLLAAGTSWLVLVAGSAATPGPPAATLSDQLVSGVVATMDSPPFAYSDGWTVDAAGADPREPTDPWTTPSGTVTFTYEGQDLALMPAVGDYWGYLYVTVDDMPATHLPALRGNVDSRGVTAGYKPLYAPEAQTSQGPTAEWVLVHRATDPGPHEVRVEIWRSWGQVPIRGVAVDAGPAQGAPTWPGVLFLVAGMLCLPAGALQVKRRTTPVASARSLSLLPIALTDRRIAQIGAGAALLGALLSVTGTWFAIWWLCFSGVGLLALAGLLRPVFWLSALMAALPFYFAVTIPLLPGRNVSIIDLGVLGAVTLVALHRLLIVTPKPSRRPTLVEILAIVLAGWALVSASSAANVDVAFYEWRTVFLYGALILPAITYTLHWSRTPERDRALLITAWLGGATIMALIALWQFSTGAMTITAEGVQRVRGLYGSPNNLALYLGRTLAVTLALGLFLRQGRVRWLSLLGALVQGAALVLTFSKGALLLALPVMLAVLWLGGLHLLRTEQRSTAPLWGLAALAGIVALALMPFLATERFQSLVDFRQGTGFLRLQLWRSSWQMALDHLWLGVGPDNFLYSYRSGYILPQAWQEPNLNHAHNWFLDWWTRLGLPGLVLGLGFWTSGLAAIRRGWQQTAGAQQVLTLGFLAAAAGALAHGLIDVSYALPDLMLVWSFMFAVAVNLLEQSR